jgi:hypothetical protein
MKPGDIVRYHKNDVWEPPHDIKNGTIGVVIKKHEYSYDLGGNHDYEVLMEGKVRLISASLLKVINETEPG